MTNTIINPWTVVVHFHDTPADEQNKLVLPALQLFCFQLLGVLAICDRHGDNQKVR